MEDCYICGKEVKKRGQDYIVAYRDKGTFKTYQHSKCLMKKIRETIKEKQDELLKEFEYG